MRSDEHEGLLIVIVNFRTAPLVIDCLASLEPEVALNPRARVVVVDNASADGSAEIIEAAIAARNWSGWVTLLVSSVNGGFAWGNNLAVRAACRDGAPPALFWLLNPDTVVRPGAIEVILRFLRAHPEAGVIGTAIEDRNGEKWPYAFRFPSLAGELEQGLRLGWATRLLANRAVLRHMGDLPARVDWVSGCSMIVRRDVFETAGLFDEGYFLYFEETDFFHRVADAGWARWYVPGAVVMHISGQSTGVTGDSANERRVPDYWFHSRRRYNIKNHGRSYAIAADLVWMLAHLTWRARGWATGRARSVPPHFLRDFLRHSALVRWSITANAQLLDRADPDGRRPTRLIAVREA